MRIDEITKIATRVLHTEADAMVQMSNGLGADFCDAVTQLLTTKGRVITSGIGKSGHVARKIASTFSSTGTPSQYVHAGDASHGDLGMITDADCVLLISSSGETKELAAIVAHTRRFGIKLFSITQRRDSTLGQQSDIVLLLPDAPEACAIGMAPTTSTTCSLALGDALAVVMMKMRHFDKDNFRAFHPGGKLGAALIQVHEIMHTDARLPIVKPDTDMGETLIEMTSKGFGVAAVVEDGVLVGAVTDGDLRRNMDGLMAKTAGLIATRNPLTISTDALAGEALGLMNAHNITALFVVSSTGKLEGLLQIHDCLRAGVA